MRAFAPTLAAIGLCGCLNPWGEDPGVGQPNSAGVAPSTGLAVTPGADGTLAPAQNADPREVATSTPTTGDVANNAGAAAGPSEEGSSIVVAPEATDPSAADGSSAAAGAGGEPGSQDATVDQGGGLPGETDSTTAPPSAMGEAPDTEEPPNSLAADSDAGVPSVVDGGSGALMGAGDAAVVPGKR